MGEGKKSRFQALTFRVLSHAQRSNEVQDPKQNNRQSQHTLPCTQTAPHKNSNQIPAHVLQEALSEQGFFT